MKLHFFDLALILPCFRGCCNWLSSGFGNSNFAAGVERTQKAGRTYRAELASAQKRNGNRQELLGTDAGNSFFVATFFV